MKRIISVFLSLILIVSTCSVMTVGAADEKDKIYLQCFDNDDLKCTVLIMTYGEIYTEIGESVQVQLTTEKETITIEQDKILREFHDAGAQLFICLPTYLSDEKEGAIPTTSTLTVSDGAFVSPRFGFSSSYSGTLSISRESRSTTLWEVIKDISGAKTKILLNYWNNEIYPKNAESRVIEGTEMLLSSQNWAWQDDEIVFTENGTTLDLSVSASVYGEHTITGKVNDFVYDSFSFTVISKEQAKKENLLILFMGTLMSILYLPLNVVAVFVMMPGWFLLQMEFDVTVAFFKQLFSKELIEDYITWVIR